VGQYDAGESWKSMSIAAKSSMLARTWSSWVNSAVQMPLVSALEGAFGTNRVGLEVGTNLLPYMRPPGWFSHAQEFPRRVPHSRADFVTDAPMMSAQNHLPGSLIIRPVCGWSQATGRGGSRSRTCSYDLRVPFWIAR
jgi:hypothetical protein